MKTIKSKIILLSFSITPMLFSQVHCGNDDSLIITNNIIIDTHFYCNKNVIRSSKNIIIGGNITFEQSKSLRIIPIKNYAIKIIPYEKIFETDSITLSRNNKYRPGGRTKIGQKGKEAKPIEILGNTITIFPNPVKDIFSIKSEENITHYKIIDTFGLIKLESKLTNNNIIVQELPQGIYTLFLYTQTQIITKTFIKN